MGKNSVNANVRKLLQEYPQTRDSDMLLLDLYWKHVDGLKDFDDIAEKGTHAESIMRQRRIIQADARKKGDESLLASPEVFMMRMRKEKSVRESKGVTA